MEKFNCLCVKKFIFYFLFFIFCLGSLFGTNELNSYDYIKLNVTNSIDFDVGLSSKSSISKFDVNSFFFPKSLNGSQYLNYFSSNYDNYEILNDSDNFYLKFDLKDELKSKNNIRNQFILESVVSKPKISKKVIYPLGSEYLNNVSPEYLEFANLIDISEDIRNQASKLAEGEDDVYVISTKLAKWIVENVDYDLSSVLENPDQTASDIFVSKQGVCKEITNLFVSMSRSVGIPARVVTGYAYTTYGEVVDYIGSNWGGHAWAEVLIGDQWVPFDLTYNQYGFVDATHIVTDKFHEIRGKGVSIDALAYGLEIVDGSLSIDNEFEILDTRESVFDTGFAVELSGSDKIGFGSQGYVRARVKNEMPYYQILFLSFAKPKEATLLGSEERVLVFRPNEVRDVYFRYNVDSNLKSGFIYTFPFTIYNEFLEETFNVNVAQSNEVFETFDLPDSDLSKETYSNNDLKFDCGYLLNDTGGFLKCDVKNSNNFEIDKLEVCIKETCKNLSLRINEHRPVSFNVDFNVDNLTYSYTRGNGIVNLEMKFPELEVDYGISYEELKVNFSIDNFLKGAKVSVYNNGVIVASKRAGESGEVDLFLEPNEYNIVVELSYGDMVFDTEEFDVISVSKPFGLRFKEFFSKFFV